MTDPPKEHAWAFNFQSDAGEQILVKALSPPQEIFNATPEDYEFMDLLDEASQIKLDKDYSQGEKFLYQGQTVYALCNYQERRIEVAAPGENQWTFHIVKTINNLKELREFLQQATEIDDREYGTEAISYFIMDMGWDEEQPEEQPEEKPQRRSTNY